MAGLLATLVILAQQPSPPSLEAAMDDRGVIRCTGRVPTPDGARIKVWAFAGSVDEGRALDARTVEVRDGAFEAQLKPAGGDRVPGRYTIVARLDDEFRAATVLTVGSDEERRRFEDRLGSEIEASLDKIRALSARLGRESVESWDREFESLRSDLESRAAIRVVGWERRLRRVLEEAGEILKMKAGRSPGIDAESLDRALAQRCKWMSERIRRGAATPEFQRLLSAALQQASKLESWPEATIRASTAREFNRIMMQLACEAPPPAYESILEAATAGRALFRAWLESPVKAEARKALEERFRDIERIAARPALDATGPLPARK